MVKKDVASIVRTYDRQVVSQLNRLYAENPRGNRAYYGSRMVKWLTNREKWHADFVASNIVSKTRSFVQKLFRDNNGIVPIGFVLAGPPPVCPICVDAEKAGVVDRAYTERVPMPAHPRCDHEWSVVRGSKTKLPPLSDVWVG